MGCFPFNKNSGFIFGKFHVPNGTVHSGCTNPTQATISLMVIVLVSRIQNSGTADNNFGKWKRTFRSDRPNEMTRPVTMDHLQSWGPFLESPGNFTGAKSNIQTEI